MDFTDRHGENSGPGGAAKPTPRRTDHLRRSAQAAPPAARSNAPLAPERRPSTGGYAELRLDRPAPNILVDQRRRRRVPIAARQTSRFLHVLGVHADRRANLLALRGHPRVEQFASVRPSESGLDMDIAAKAD